MAKTKGRILALDIGQSRVGIALTDELRLTIRGLPTLLRKNRQTDLEALATLIREHEVGLVLVGNPVHMSGEKSEQSGQVERFAARLHARIKAPIELWDERLTSVEAEQSVRQQSGRAATSREAHRQAVDQTAAVVILESYLNSQSQGSA
ncbi:MAG: Holliday junction resolvase RuvX [Acidobacteria bacterium]|nr:Holliday junction resolvase RuvX [Acidobacteriota bacterium]